MRKRFILTATVLYGAVSLFSRGAEMLTDDLIAAARSGNVVKLDQLLDKGAAIDALNYNTETALMIAAAAGKMETVKELLKRGASIDFLNKNNRSAIFYAVFMGHEDVALELLKAGATFEVPDQNGCTALIAASRDGMANLVKALVEKGANVNAVSTEGITPLMEAAGFSEPINKSLELVRLLLDSEADIDLEDFHGDTALTIAGQRGRTAVVQFLSDRGAK